MEQQKELFTREALRRLILPLMVEQLLAVTIGMADTVMVASVGEGAVAAVALVDAINVLALNIFAALASGGAIVASQYLGKGDGENARRSARQLLFIVAVLGIGSGLLCAVFSGPILQGLYAGTDAAILADANGYFMVTSLSYPFIALYSAGTAIFRAQGNSRISMQASLLFNLVNIGGNAVLIYGFGMGVLGAAIPTLVSRIVGAVLVLALLRRPELAISLRDWREFSVRPQMIRRILAVGIPSGLENSMFQIGKLLVQRLVSSLGTVAVASLAVANPLAMLALIPAQGINLAMMTVVGQCMGAGEKKQAAWYTKRLTGLAFVIQAVLCGGLYFASPWLVLPFRLSAETAAITLRLIEQYFVMSAVFWVFSFTLPNGLRAAGDVRFTMLVSVFSMWIFRIGASYLLVRQYGLGVYGVWYGMFIDWIVRLILFIWRFASGKWQNKKVI